MPDTNNENSKPLAQVKPAVVDHVVRTPDGAVDLVQTAINELRATGGVIETNEVVDQISAEEYIEILHKEILGHRRAWAKENERADGLKTQVIFLWFFIAVLLGVIIILKVSRN